MEKGAISHQDDYIVMKFKKKIENALKIIKKPPIF